MDYLAHLYLAEDEPESLIGSLMGDFAKGRIDDGLAPGIRWGIVVHRMVDVFTDAHAIVGRSKRRLRSAVCGQAVSRDRRSPHPSPLPEGEGIMV